MSVAPERASIRSAVGGRPGRRLELLLICDPVTCTAANVADNIEALRAFSRHRVLTVPAFGGLPPGLELGRFDGVLVHWTIFMASSTFMGPTTRQAIREFTGLKAAFIQDDYRQIEATHASLRDLGMHIVFGLADTEVIDRIYPAERLPGIRRECVLPGYVDEALTRRQVRPYRDRPLDIGYRGRTVPAWLGRFSRDKVLIAELFTLDAKRHGLSHDIACRESDRIYGEAWIEFLTNCKAVLGTESGASVFDYSGEIQAAVETYVTSHSHASFDEVHERFVRHAEEPVPLRTISSRCFEAAALRTLMVLYEGRYSDRLVPWRHYVPLKKDHSNVEDVVAFLRDPARAQAMIDCAFEEVARNPANNFRAFVQQTDAVIDAVFTPVMAARMSPYDELRFRARFHRHQLRRHRLLYQMNLAVHRGLDLVPPAHRPRVHETLRRGWRILQRLALGERFRA